ncbi:Cu resistance protein [Neorhizobium sp. P12A]|uniref:copper homeostasis periplasmic binding protein CopC n=1 Tax=Neorhizobium sp. P12A TaxID=2268027 RepID=UPI0011EF53F1|nr:copper homeostasis periplasmic binding protein CopC [Neorhizobium sp. P12A]KAA0699985.1 Cu resistance protein [Neorhizobium sp. P12A]
MRKRIMIIGLAAALIALARPAFAHAELTTSSPADGSSVSASPTELDLSFSEALNLNFSGLTITGSDKSAIETGDPMLMDGDKVLIVPVSQTLSAGAYTVYWHVLSTDGHKSSGSYSFTVTP